MATVVMSEYVLNQPRSSLTYRRVLNPNNYPWHVSRDLVRCLNCDCVFFDNESESNDCQFCNMKGTLSCLDHMGYPLRPYVSDYADKYIVLTE